MLKDIFIDNNIAKNFSNPLDPEYKKLIRWLITDDRQNSANNAYLVISPKLIAEYQRTARDALSPTNIVIIIVSQLCFRCSSTAETNRNIHSAKP